jgi:hypothetical protein
MVLGFMKTCLDSDKGVSWIFAGNTIKGCYDEKSFLGE